MLHFLSKIKEASASNEEKFISKFSNSVMENIMAMGRRGRAQVISQTEEDEEFILNAPPARPSHTRGRQTLFSRTPLSGALRNS
jgi:hypothetical protein